MRSHVRETVKTALIIVLSLAAIALSLLAFAGSSLSGSGRYGRLLSALTRQEHYRIEPYTPGTSAGAAALPMQISVKNELGRASFQRSADAAESAYNALGSLLGEALGALALPGETVSEQQWTRALQAQGAYFRYSGALPVQLIAAWLDVGTQLEDACSAFLLEIHGETVRLLCRTEAGYRRFETTVPAAQLSDALSGYRPDGSAFACEGTDETLRRLAGDSLLSMTRTVQLPAAAVLNPMDNALKQQLAASLGMNPYGNFYTTTQGTTVYEEASRSVSITSGGLLQLHNSDLSNTQLCAASSSDAALAEFAQQLLQQLCGSVCGDVRLSLTGISRTGSAATLQFNYMLSGLPVRLSGRSCAAELTFSGESLTGLSLCLRSYSLTQKQLTLLPELQAAAVVQETTRLEACYLDSGSTQLTAGWIKE